MLCNYVTKQDTLQQYDISLKSVVFFLEFEIYLYLGHLYPIFKEKVFRFRQLMLLYDNVTF